MRWFQYGELLLQWRAGFQRVCTTSLPLSLPPCRFGFCSRWILRIPTLMASSSLTQCRENSRRHILTISTTLSMWRPATGFSPPLMFWVVTKYICYILYGISISKPSTTVSMWIVNCGHRCFFNLAFSSFRSPPLSRFGSTFSKYGIYYKFQTNTLIIIRIFCCSKIVFLWCRPIFTMRLCSFQELPLGNLSFWSLFKFFVPKKSCAGIFELKKHSFFISDIMRSTHDQKVRLY